MKRGTLRHPKTLELAERLDCDPGTALGVVESLVEFVREFAPRGDVGRWSDRRIELALEMPRLRAQVGEGAIVAALTAAGYLDAHPAYRLLVHDWPQHADEGVKKKLQRAKLGFALPSDGVETCRDTVAQPPPPTSGHVERESHSVARLPDPSKALPDQGPTRPSLTASDAVASDAGRTPARQGGRELGLRTTAEWDDAGLIRLHAQYPKPEGVPVSRVKAIPLWDAMRPDRETQAAMSAGLDAYKATKRWQRDQWRFVPSLATFLAERMWEHPPEAEPDEQLDELDRMAAEYLAEKAAEQEA